MQASVAMEMISPSSGDNTALQLHMGEGKSSVIIPICCAALADHSKLVRVVVLKSLAVQMFQLLVERLGGLTNRRIFYLPFSRSLRITPAHAKTIQSLFSECQHAGGILVTQPDHILSFKLMTVEQQLSPADAGARPSTALAMPLLSSQRWLDMHTRDLFDESDELLHVRFELVYTIGDQKDLEGCPDRWTTTQQVMTLVSEHARHLQNEFPLGVKFQPGAVGSFSRFRILDVRAGEKLVQLVSDDILDGKLPNFMFEHVPSRIKDAIRKCFTISTTDVQCLDEVRQYCAGSSLWSGLLLIRGLLAHGILVYALKERRWRIDYGLDRQRTMLAVPYRAKDVPSCRAEFGHPDIAIILTCLSYYYGGLDEKQLAACFGKLLKQDNPALEYETWIRGLHLLPESLQHLSGINMESAEQFTDCLVPHFGRNKTVIDFYLAQIVFRKEAKEFPNKLSCSAWDLAERKPSGLPTTGFSGTNDFRFLLPTTMEQRALAHQRATNARVLTYLLQPENDRYNSHAAGEGALELLQVIAKQAPEIRVLLDVGAQVLDLQNDEVAKAWLEIKQDAKAAIYFNKHDELVVLTRDQVVEPFTASSFAQRVDQCVLYLDDAHTRGIDIKLPREFRAAVTLGPKVTKDRLVQG
jgi:CheY-like chemotaxis protein